MLRISLNSSTFPHWLRLDQINDICRSAALCVPTMSRGHVSVCLCLCLCLSMCQGQLCVSDNSSMYYLKKCLIATTCLEELSNALDNSSKQVV